MGNPTASTSSRRTHRGMFHASNRRSLKTASVGSWIESTFSRRECCQFLPSDKDNSRCCCGNRWQYHNDGSPAILQSTVLGDLHWSPLRHTTLLPTNAHGTLEFRSGSRPTRACYARVSFDSRPEQLLQLLVAAWRVQLPRLVVSVHGGRSHFELTAGMRKALRRGLLKTARATTAWIITDGINSGVSRHVGDALVPSQSWRAADQRTVCLGVAPWGVLQGRHHQLLGRDCNVLCHWPQPLSSGMQLNARHTNFILADDGTAGRYGADYLLRRDLEKHISRQRLSSRVSGGIPVVCVVVEGGLNTLRAVLDYVTDTPPVPVVVCEGSGRVTDILAFAIKLVSCDKGVSILDSPMIQQRLLAMIHTILGRQHSDKLLADIIQCCHRRELITVYSCTEGHELDETILKALLRGYHMSAPDQLHLALSWNRVDIARATVFSRGGHGGVEWPPGILEQVMSDALVNDRVDFVKLLLESGVMMRNYLTIARLEELYNSNQGPANSLHCIVSDVCKSYSPHGRLSLFDIGRAINHLMGGAYRSLYSRRKFRVVYNNIMLRSSRSSGGAVVVTCSGAVNTPCTVAALAPPGRASNRLGHRSGDSNFSGGSAQGCNTNLNRTHDSNSYAPWSTDGMDGLLPNAGLAAADGCVFRYPFSELMMWAVLTNRPWLARFFWRRHEDSLAKCLVACRLYKSLAQEAADDNLDSAVSDDLNEMADEFENIALEVVDSAYICDQDGLKQLLTCELASWSCQTCLSLAVMADHKRLLARPCCQVLLSELWTGALRLRRHGHLQVVMALLVPVFISRLEFCSRDELRLMPHTAEEHWTQMTARENCDGADDVEDAVLVEFDDAQRCRHMNGSQSVDFPTSLYNGVKSQSTAHFDSLKTTGRRHSSHHTSPDGGGVDGAGFDHCLDVSSSAAAGQGGGGGRRQQMDLRRKIYEFYKAPVVKFWALTLSYVVFLCLLTFVVLVEMSPQYPRWQEVYVTLYIFSLALDRVRDVIISEPYQTRQKLCTWLSCLWNLCDTVFIGSYLLLQPLRYTAATFRWARVLICCNSVYWYIRLFETLSVEKYLGPMVAIAGKMLVKMMHLLVLLVIVLFSFGVLRQSVRYPHQPASWYLLRHVFYQPYFMLYGEVFAPDIEPDCGDGDKQQPCELWITVVAMTAYLLVANILMLNLLIAVFNNIFSDIHAVAHQVWMFQRYRLVMQYDSKTVCPPPLVLFELLYRLLKLCFNRYRRVAKFHDRGIKLFVDAETLESVHEFEEQCVEEFERRKQMAALQKPENMIQQALDRQTTSFQRLEELLIRQQSQLEQSQRLHLRMQQLDDLFAPSPLTTASGRPAPRTQRRQCASQQSGRHSAALRLVDGSGTMRHELRRLSECQNEEDGGSSDARDSEACAGDGLGQSVLGSELSGGLDVACNNDGTVYSSLSTSGDDGDSDVMLRRRCTAGMSMLNSAAVVSIERVDDRGNGQLMSDDEDLHQSLLSTETANYLMMEPLVCGRRRRPSVNLTLSLENMAGVVRDERTRFHSSAEQNGNGHVTRTLDEAEI